ncbi:MAG: PocR ligand-binding domain-containing protein [Clostridia bacterium]|nr:PocR ligand-binding domain-containing protein [Clostridia bacterium]
MPLKLDTYELADLMKNFYTLTGIRIVIFDEDYKEILSYPEENSSYCACMRRNEEFDRKCCESDKISFETCKKTGSLTMYKCHAGLIEATYPITDKGSIIGYIMFGQVSNEKDREEFFRSLTELSQSYTSDGDIAEAVKKIKYKSRKQLLAAAKILEACTGYILFKELIKPSRAELFNSLDNYIDTHLDEDISVPVLCDEFHISRTRLYALCKQYIPCGIAAYVKTKRLKKAKDLLRTTDMSVTDIAHSVGFADYNYFLKAFKKQFGVSTKGVRREVG